MDEFTYLKDKIQNIEQNYLKKDDRDFRIVQDRVDKLEENYAEMRANYKVMSTLLEKNNTLVEKVNIQSERLTIILETMTKDIKSSKIKIEDMSEKIILIDKDTSKNTDSRITNKGIIVAVITALIISIVMFSLGGALATAGKEVDEHKYNTESVKQLT